jgi:hypothetical protein
MTDNFGSISGIHFCPIGIRGCGVINCVSKVIPSLVVAFGVNWRFRGYDQTPELAIPYATSRHRRSRLFLFWGVMVTFLIVALALLGPHRLF